jgi:hypothetical protein
MICELVDQSDPCFDELLAAPGQRPQYLGRLAVLGECRQAVSIDAQHVGEQAGIPGIGLGPNPRTRSGCAGP